MSDWKQDFAIEADKALGVRMVKDVIDEQLDNLRVSNSALARYGLTKIAHYAATVARAQALGIDPEALVLSRDEGNAAMLDLAERAARAGKPVFIIETEQP